MNDNITPEGPAHAQALALLNDLYVILDNASVCGLEKYDHRGDAVFDFAFWADECAKTIGIAPVNRNFGS